MLSRAWEKELLELVWLKANPRVFAE